MTIALAIHVTDGIVIAADTQESYGFPGGPKVSQPKVRAYDTQDGVLAVSGAGTAGYIDALSDEFGRVFRDNAEDTIDALQPKLAACLRQFHADSIIPLAVMGDRCPTVQMLLAIKSKNIPLGEILTSTGTVLSRAIRYACVGCGETYAKAILAKYRSPEHTERASALAAYVIWAVKESAESCGHRTTVTIIHGPRDLAMWEEMDWGRIDELEQYFLRDYARDEKKRLWRALDQLNERWLRRQGRRAAQRSPRSSTRGRRRPLPSPG